ncbi:unnamed protein product [Amoebophrya sp. A25]|nr:unnamed protein product [Amoebophrya sp. A25]|eukprot:GSA25T00006794001.1
MGAPSTVRVGSITSLVCQGCRARVDTREAMTKFYEKHAPRLVERLGVRRSLENWNWGTRKQVGIYSTAHTHPPNAHVTRLLNNGGVKCWKCGCEGCWASV